MDGATPRQGVCGDLAGLKVAFIGRLAAMNHGQAQELVRRHGGVPVDRLHADLDVLVVAEGEFPLDPASTEQLDEAISDLAQRGELEIIRETDFWRRLGLVDEHDQVRQLYTPAMLADLTGVPVATVRHWQSRGLIQPARQVHRLAYFDFREVQTARRLAELLAAGVSAKSIERQLQRWRQYLPQVERPLAQLAIIVQGKDLLLRSDAGLIEAGGQRRFDFELGDAAQPPLAAPRPTSSMRVDELVAAAEDLEAVGDLPTAAEMYRAALASAGPDAEICFRLAELLYRAGELQAARERYYMTLEIDEEYVEARANLGCVLMEQGQLELAIAAFQGAIAFHPDYADAHYQLARALDEAARPEEALPHWQTFVRLAPSSPWTELARRRLEQSH
jgi:tetratricopeptide (TPR) repeat protein